MSLRKTVTRQKAGTLAKLLNAPIIVAGCILVGIGVSGFLLSEEKHREVVANWPTTFPLQVLVMLVMSLICGGMVYLYNALLRFFGFIEKAELRPIVKISFIWFVTSGFIFLIYKFLKFA